MFPVFLSYFSINLQPVYQEWHSMIDYGMVFPDWLQTVQCSSVCLLTESRPLLRGRFRVVFEENLDRVLTRLLNRFTQKQLYYAKLRGQICYGFKNIKFFRWLRDIHTLLSLLFTSKFSSARQFKNHIELFSTFLDESCLSQM